MKKPHYPYIECEEHGRQLSYMVCRHVLLHGALPTVDDFELATPTAMGVIVCEAEHPSVLDGFIVVCAQHAAEFMPHETKVKR